jgi:hypothetical protein
MDVVVAKKELTAGWKAQEVVISQCGYDAMRYSVIKGGFIHSWRLARVAFLLFFAALRDWRSVVVM